MSHQVMSQNSKSRPFACNECGRRFYQSSNLNTHLKFHRESNSGLVKRLKVHRLGKETEVKDDCDDKVKCEMSSEITCHKKLKCESNSVNKKLKCEPGRDITYDKILKCESNKGNKKLKCETGSDITYDKILKCESNNENEKCETSNDITCNKRSHCEYDCNSQGKNLKCETSPNADCDKESHILSTNNSRCDEESKCEIEIISRCDKDFKCEYCSKTFTKSVSYEMHLKTHMGSLVHCHLCGKSFKEAQYLSIHMRIHSGNKPHTCPVCNKSFSQLSNYSTHLRIHSGEKPYHCDICDKTFSNSGNRDTHRRTHTGEKPFMCDICGLSFARPNSLKMHHNLHTGERPYQCDRCEKAFVSSGKLVDHKRTHTGEKPYTCEICGLSFAIVNTFKRHKKIHSGQKPHVCVHCGKRFFRREGLRSHLKTHTGQSSDPASVRSDTEPIHSDLTSHNDLAEIPVLTLPIIGQTSHNALDGIPLQILNTYAVPAHTLPIPQANYKIGEWIRHDSIEDQQLKEITDPNDPNSVKDRIVYKRQVGMGGTLFRDPSGGVMFKEPSNDAVYREPTGHTVYRNPSDGHSTAYEEHIKVMELREPTTISGYGEALVYRDPSNSGGREPRNGSEYAVSVSGNDRTLCRDGEHTDIGDTNFDESSGVHSTLYRQHVDVDDHTGYGDSADVTENNSVYSYSLKQTTVMYDAHNSHNRNMYSLYSGGNSKILAVCDSDEISDKYGKALSASLPHKIHSGLACSVENLNVPSALSVVSKQQENAAESESTSDKIYLPSTITDKPDSVESVGCFDHHSSVGGNDRNQAGYFCDVPSRDGECDSHLTYHAPFKNVDPVGPLCLSQNITRTVLTSESISLPQYSFTSGSRVGEILCEDAPQNHQSGSDVHCFETSQQVGDTSISGSEDQRFNKYYMNQQLQTNSQTLSVLPVIKSIFSASGPSSCDVACIESDKSEHCLAGKSDPLEMNNSEQKVRTLESPGECNSEQRVRILKIPEADTSEPQTRALEFTRTDDSASPRTFYLKPTEIDNQEPSDLSNSENKNIVNNSYGNNDNLQNSIHSISENCDSPVNGTFSRNDSHATEDCGVCSTDSSHQEDHESKNGVHMSPKPGFCTYLNVEQIDESDGDEICVDVGREQVKTDRSNENEACGVEEDNPKRVFLGKTLNFREPDEICQKDFKKLNHSVGKISNRAWDIYDGVTNSIVENAKTRSNKDENSNISSSKSSTLIDKNIVDGGRRAVLVKNSKMYSEESSILENKECRKIPKGSDANHFTNISAEPQEVNSRIASERRRDGVYLFTKTENDADKHCRYPEYSISSGIQNTSSLHCGVSCLSFTNSHLNDRCKSSECSDFSASQSSYSDTVHGSISKCIQSSSFNSVVHPLSCKEDTYSNIAGAGGDLMLKKGHIKQDNSDERKFLKVNIGHSDLSTGGISNTDIQTNISVRDENRITCASSTNTDIKFDGEIFDGSVNSGPGLSNYSILSKSTSVKKRKMFGVPEKVGTAFSDDYGLLADINVKPDPDSSVCSRVETVAYSTVKSVVKCAVCKSVFVDHVHLEEHLRENPRHIIKCHVCGKEFSDQQYLKNHLRVHTKERPYECEICGKRFAQSGNYVIHMRIHTGDKPYMCPVCSKCFTSSGNRDSHQKIHTGDKPYMCDICGETFSRPGSLKTHRRIHTGERPYRCDMCDKAFVSSGKLKDHRRIHTGEKPYICEVCGLSFAIVNTFRRHKKIHTGDRPHRCVVCSKAFIRLEGLRNHQKTHRKEKPNISAAADTPTFDGHPDGRLVMETDDLTSNSFAESKANESSVAVGRTVLDGYASSSVLHLKHPQMLFASALGVSPNTECHRNQEGDVHNRDVYFYENVGNDMGTFVYPTQQ